MKTNTTTALSGALLIDKPAGISSYDCIRTLKRIITQKKIKIGHTGTLDVFASGLLVVCIGRPATKLITEMITFCKSYSAIGALGYATDTEDVTGTVVEQLPRVDISPSKLQQALAALSPTHIQTPPIYSALKHNGTPLYRYAREKLLTTEELTRICAEKARHVEIYSGKITTSTENKFRLSVTVSKGTYIRTLVGDIGRLLNNCATTVELRRTVVGPFRIEQSIPLAKLKNVNDIDSRLIDITDLEKIVTSYTPPRVSVDS